MKFSPSAVILIILGFTTSTTFMIWLNCYQELAKSYGIATRASCRASTPSASSSRSS